MKRFSNGSIEEVSIFSRLHGVYFLLPTPELVQQEVREFKGQYSLDFGPVLLRGEFSLDVYLEVCPELGEFMIAIGATFIQWGSDELLPVSVVAQHLNHVIGTRLCDPCGGHDGPIGGRFLFGCYSHTSAGMSLP